MALSPTAVADAAPRILVFCRSQRWWGQIRQARWVETHAWIRFLPQLEQLEPASREGPQTFSILELPANGEAGLIDLVARLASRQGGRPVACLAEPHQAAHEFAYREAGAALFLTSVAEFPRLQRAVKLYLQSLPPLRLPWDQAIIHQLPWRSLLP